MRRTFTLVLSFLFLACATSALHTQTINASVTGRVTDTSRALNNIVIGPRQPGPFFVSGDLRQGTLGCNALRGFASNQLNFAVRRQVNFTERFNLQFRAELFNLFNHPSFANLIGALGSVAAYGAVIFCTASFGQSPSMLNASLGSGGQTGGFNPLYQIGGARSIPLALKLQF